MNIKVEKKLINFNSKNNSKYVEVNKLYVKKTKIKSKFLDKNNNDLKTKFIKFDARLNVNAQLNNYHKKYFKKKGSELSPKNFVKNNNRRLCPNIDLKKAPSLYYNKYNNIIYNKLKKHHLKLYPLNFQTTDEFLAYKFVKNNHITLNKNYIIKLYIKKTKNNLFITIFTDKLLYTKTITTLGFKGRSKQSQFAYKMLSENIVDYLQNLKKSNIKYGYLNIYFKNHYSRRLKSLIRNINKVIKINKICNITPIPFNGCRKRKISIRKKKRSIVKLLSY